MFSAKSGSVLDIIKNLIDGVVDVVDDTKVVTVASEFKVPYFPTERRALDK